MRFALSPEQADFAASVRKLLDAGRTPAAVRAWAAGDREPGRALLGQLAEQGVLGLAIDEDNGGMGAEPIDLVVAFVELGRAAAPGPLVESAAAIPALLQALPDADAAQRWLPGIAEGSALATIAFESAGTTVALDAEAADVVFVVSGDRVTVGRATGEVRSVDPARRLSTVAPGETVAEGERARAAVARAFDAGVLACAAQQLGAGRALLHAATEYAKQRKQFGRPIGEFQAVKQKLADVLIALDLAEPLLYRAALTFDEPSRERDVSAAAVACGEAAYTAARAALQVHGAIGYTAEYDLSLWLTKVTALRSAWGTADVHRGRIARALREEALRERALRGTA
ncbi:MULTISPECIES: acyl-CoA dehydrogenase family protein [Nocardia]|uniref:acyl-CoA dehydrogenase family protein n=1 Tax=Nocardia TaxID=1817 RepID=UPI000BF1B737|nr:MULTISPECIES: acyl-CoA dehydrogenase family protein [Nocardia]MBF6187248.1 acyl-CoA/acyl-ACP dehydrogenase [Nocardia farcinica]MBF6312897.1 acyl-CoA/acyl-ACP dehydrogenase [Nocardia farcinica]MBF6408248.1 acyl-CoA/acyl-ACP dehydrogenase [Nocardia farcinica]PEH78724.1 acyl-CoA dehydrogenase [Nocardia sp. FDAARGOS_372]UEX23349.1 acyl-CoA/acyl-ACP dehydrogenase [Nocardia farcinica]